MLLIFPSQTYTLSPPNRINEHEKKDYFKKMEYELKSNLKGDPIKIPEGLNLNY